MPNRIQSGHFTEADAAIALGMSVGELRELVTSRLLGGDDWGAAEEKQITFSRSDLVVLKVLASQRPVLV
jgi:hypothetical protein